MTFSVVQPPVVFDMELCGLLKEPSRANICASSNDKLRAIYVVNMYDVTILPYWALVSTHACMLLYKSDSITHCSFVSDTALSFTALQLQGLVDLLCSVLSLPP